jgi:hypothetical protein
LTTNEPGDSASSGDLSTLSDPLDHREGKGALDFGVLAVRNGLLTPDQLEDCRQQQQASANLGKNLTLKQIVLERNLMTESDVARVERAQAQLTQDRERKPRDRRHAIRLANDTSFGLGAAVFTADVAEGERIARDELNAGCCFVNSFVRSDPRLPFGGIMDSGYGRELGRQGIHEFVNAKMVQLA